MITLSRLLLVSALLTMAACASVPFDYPKTPSTALVPSGNTRLGEIDRSWEKEHGELSGFIGLEEGIDALGARLRLMELAEATIDAQYFIVKKDKAGALFAGKMLRAADRGVRVRLLVDDVFSPGVDQAFSLLNSHPNVEVRLFNPLSRQSFKYWSYAVDFNRANRRMHNKSFTVDNAMSIVGGRNIGEEYFELHQDVKFDDFEVLAMGPVVGQVSAGFDTYWNSDLAVPMDAFNIKVDPSDLDAWREYIRKEMSQGTEGLYGQAMNSSLLQRIRGGDLTPLPAMAVLVTDPPEKLQNKVGDKEFAVLGLETKRRIQETQKELIIITPYFIPQAGGIKLLKELLARDVRVIVITNSLASTNHVAVYSAYRRYRKELLQAGVEIYEIRADTTGGTNAWGLNPEMFTLHSKATLFDRGTIFVGSLNFDPRSILINSEMGLYIDSPEGAKKLYHRIMDDIGRVTYQVVLEDEGKVRWLYEHDGKNEVLKKSPLTSWGRRFMAGFYGLLPIENQL